MVGCVVVNRSPATSMLVIDVVLVDDVVLADDVDALGVVHVLVVVVVFVLAVAIKAYAKTQHVSTLQPRARWKRWESCE
eukprot:563443-Amphidinium_carterae.1